MSRIRSVHPGFFTDEDLVAVSMGARLLFIGLGVEADDKGIFEWKPLTIKMRVFPADNVDVAELLAELESAGAVRRYTAQGRNFGAIRNFRKFQKPKTPNNIHPAPAEILAFVGLADQITEIEGDEVEAFPPKGEKSPQMEEGGEEEEVSPPTPRKRGNGAKHVLPSDWQVPEIADLPPEARACAGLWTSASYKTHGEAFTNYWRGEGKMKTDWRMAWANRVVDIHDRVMRSQKFGNDPPGAGSSKPVNPDGGKLLAQYQAGEITFDEFDRQRREAETPRSKSTGPPRPIGEVLRVVASGGKS